MGIVVIRMNFYLMRYWQCGLVVTVPTGEVTDDGYINAFINKTDAYFKNKVDRGWMEADVADKSCNKLKESGISSIFQVKIQS
jgi:hypothetical protein